MELLIKIPEKIYKSIQDNTYCGISNSDMYDAIRNGIPLPKGHGALKDADEVMKVMERNCDMQDLYLPIHFKQFALDEAQTIIEADKQCGDDCEHCEWVTCPKMEADE